jgi:DNA mismatch endonuclease, patch repair protein
LADIVSPEIRSRMMSGIRSRNTKPELIIRAGMKARKKSFQPGDEYIWRGSLLPGKPDLVFPRPRAVILVHGCFWHGHDCALFRWPSSNEEFWRSKILGNIARDCRVRDQLRDRDWRVLEVWECTLKGRNRLPAEEVIDRCLAFVDSDEPLASIGGDQTVTVEASA